MSDRSKLLDIFKPRVEARDPALFAGRKREIVKLIDALAEEGCCAVVHGEKGLGKSSLAAQAERIAGGDTELLDGLGLGERALDENDCFYPIWVTCTGDVRCHDDIVRWIMHEAKSLFNPSDLVDGAKGKLEVERGFNLAIFTQKAKTTWENESKQSFEALSAEQQFDRVPDTSGLAAFIKKKSGENIKFVLVGIANKAVDLLADHGSVERQVVPIPVEHMPDEDLRQIVTRAAARLGERNLDFAFTAGAIGAIVREASGFPWFVHLLGRGCLLRACELDVRSIAQSDVEAVVEDVAQSEMAQIYHARYASAVGRSRRREAVLRLMAAWDGPEIDCAAIDRMARSIEITNPSGCRRDLANATHGAAIVDAGTPGRNCVRFVDAIFKVYVNLRAGIHPDVKELVKLAYRNRPPP